MLQMLNYSKMQKFEIDKIEVLKNAVQYMKSLGIEIDRYTIEKIYPIQFISFNLTDLQDIHIFNLANNHFHNVCDLIHNIPNIMNNFKSNKYNDLNNQYQCLFDNFKKSIHRYFSDLYFEKHLGCINATNIFNVWYDLNAFINCKEVWENEKVVSEYYQDIRNIINDFETYITTYVFENLNEYLQKQFDYILQEKYDFDILNANQFEKECIDRQHLFKQLDKRELLNILNVLSKVFNDEIVLSNYTLPIYSDDNEKGYICVDTAY